MTTPPIHPAPWRICIETGGTFTDCVALTPSGEIRRAKVLSSGAIRLAVTPRSPTSLHAPIAPPAPLLLGYLATCVATGRAARVTAHDGDTLSLDADVGSPSIIELSTGEPATVLASRLVTQTPAGTALPPAHVRFATTRGTNALLERKLTPVAFFVSSGFADLLDIGDQRRPDLFALDIKKPAPFHAATVEVPGRLDPAGQILRELDLAPVLLAARGLLSHGISTASIALMHSWRNPAHEHALAQALRDLGFTHVTCSSDLAPRIRIVPRARTSVVNAALSGPIEHFLSATTRAWAPDSLRLDVMTSAGGLVPAPRYAPKDSLLSGPAAGVRGAAAVGLAVGFDRVIAFDMGGTSTDVTRIDREVEYTIAHRVGDAELLSPALPVHSVAAGGGSICDVEITRAPGAKPSVRLTVGPKSAGADPGPACYARGGPLTITDVNLLLARLDPHRFQIPVSVDAARAALARLSAKIRAAGAPIPADRDLLEGLLAIANQRMAAAIRAISVRKGYNPADYALVAFGGAGGQHACAVAADLGISTILCPADASLLSAVGLLASAREVIREQQLLQPLTAVAPRLPELFDVLSAAASEALRDAGEPGPAAIRRIASLRYQGQDHTLELDWSPNDPHLDLRAAFESRSREVFGFVLPRQIEVESLRIVASGQVAPLPARAAAPSPSETTAPRTTGSIERAALIDSASQTRGPALILDQNTTVVLEPTWSAQSRPDGTLVLTRQREHSATSPLRHSATSAPLLPGRLHSLGESMGELLGRTAISTNVKERLDYSCALLDPAGNLIISAPHIPVHLGALGVCVRLLRDRVPMNPGDVLITNHPALGGSHLPDVTFVAPSHDAQGRLLGYAACRAHHAEIGGTRPGSMPPDATCLAQEGVVIPPTHLVQGNAEPRWDLLRSLLASAPFPSRAIEENLADLAAQLAAIRMGTSGLAEIARTDSPDALSSAMAKLASRAESHARAAIANLGPPDTTQESTLDDGTRLRVRIHSTPNSSGPALIIDFAGSSGLHPGSLNAPLGVIHSAVMYCIRLLISAASAGAASADIPLNDGLMRPVDLRVPSGFLNPDWPALGDDPSRLPAVAGGNVETSQAVVNLVLHALGLSAHGQGTMNNLLFGPSARATLASPSYYETIGGGAGATPTAPGASGVHTHMTNTAITDPEILEHRYPVRLERFTIRRGSGGHGTNPGGDGLLRELTFLAPLSVCLLTSNRHAGPGGLALGGPGSPGRQTLTRADGSAQILRHADAFDALPNDRLTIETPGGGAWTPDTATRHSPT